MEFFDKAKQKLSDVWYDTKRAARKAVVWCKENKEATVAIITVGVPTVYKIVKSVGRTVEAKADEKHRELTTYDRRTDSYLQLRRSLKPNEQRELAERMAAGEGKTEVLYSMGLLKR